MSGRIARWRRASRVRLACLALLALLFQQAALAAYACPIDTAPTPVVMAGCEDMKAPDPVAPALCEQHCVRDHVASPDAKVLQVPALALPPLHFDLSHSLLPTAEAQHYANVPVCRTDPPPAQRFCSLQI